MTKASGRWIVTGVLFLLPLGLMVAPGLPHGQYELVVDMRPGDSPTSACGNVEVWINSLREESLHQPTLPGERHSYRFPVKNHKSVEYLRIDPTDAAGVPVRLFGVRIENQGKIIHEFTPRDLAGWYTNADQSMLEEDALLLRAGHADPVLTGNFPAIRLPGAHRSFLGRLGVSLVSGEHSREITLVMLTVSTLLILVLGLLGGGRLSVVVLAIALPLTYLCFRLFSGLGGRPPDGSSALGYALYAGYPKSAEYFLEPLLIGVPALVALIAVYLQRRLMKSPAAGAGDFTSLGGGRKKGHVLILALLTAALACYFCPDLKAARPSAASPIALQWDGNNGMVWRYLFQNDAKPYKEYWYPYSGQILFELSYPYGELCLTLHQFILFTIFLLAVYLCTGRALAATLAIFATIFGLYVNGFFQWPERYGLVTNVLLAYAAIDRGVPRPRAGHVLFWLAAVHAAVIEPTSALYVGVPLFVALALDALRSPRSFCALLVGRLGREFVPPAVVLAGVGIYLAIQGELTGFLAFMSSLGTQAAYGAYPIDLPAWLRLEAPSEAFLLGSIVVLIGLGLVREFDAAERKSREGRVLLLLGIAAAMLMLKQFLRPHIANQLLIINVVGIVFYLFAGQKTNVWQRSGAIFAAGLLFAHLGTSNYPMQVVNNLRTAVARVRASAPCLALDARQRKALTAQFFALNHFQLSDAYVQAVRALAHFASSEGAGRLFVLSDDPIFYVLAGVRPYFHTNGYNAAPIQEQKHMIRMLESEPPRVIVWRCADGGVDGVPPVLRDVLLYEHVILHYVPVEPSSPAAFLLLRRRRPEEAVAVDFWRDRLGFDLNLGHIPRFSSPARFRELNGQSGEEVAEFLTLRITDAAALPSISCPKLPDGGSYHPTGQPVAVPVQCAGRSFTIVLSVVPEQSEYHVPLNRVWFWSALKKAGFSPTLGKPGPGIEVRIERRAMNDDILY